MRKIGKSIIDIAKTAIFIAIILMSLELVYAAFLSVRDYKYHTWVPTNATLTYEDVVEQNGEIVYEHKYKYMTEDGSIMEAHSIDDKTLPREGYMVVYYNPENDLEVIPDAFRRKVPDMMKGAVTEVIITTVFVLIFLFMNNVIRYALSSISKPKKKRGKVA